MQLGPDYRLHPVKEEGPGGWITSTRYLPEAPGNWSDEEVTELLDVAQKTVQSSLEEMNLRGKVIRKKRSVGLVPTRSESIPREALDETVLRVVEAAQKMNRGAGPTLPYCAFNGGSDMWLDVGNKRVGVQVLQSYLGISSTETLHIGDQFLNTGNDFAARDVCPCVWITSPEETTYILKSILRLAGLSVALQESHSSPELTSTKHTLVKWRIKSRLTFPNVIVEHKRYKPWMCTREKLFTAPRRLHSAKHLYKLSCQQVVIIE